jgi:hypothetical protein
MLTTIVHELAHATTAFALGVRATLYHYYAALDLTPAQTESGILIAIRLAGPLVSFACGILSGFAFRRARGSAVELPLLYLTVFGLGTFFGNLMSASFVGDFSQAAAALGLPMALRHAISAVGLAAVAAIHFWAGRALVPFAPVAAGRWGRMTAVIVLPVTLGIGVVILTNWPLPEGGLTARLGEASFWIFGAAGAATARVDTRRHRTREVLHWADAIVLLAVVIAVRAMVRGIPLVP